MKVLFLMDYSRAKTNDKGEIVGWEDYKTGSVHSVPPRVAKQLEREGIAEPVKEKKAKE